MATVVSPASAEAARRLWASEKVEAAPPEAVVAAIEHVCTRLRLGLGRWIGYEGYCVLLGRVLEEAGAENPALRGLRCLPDGDDRVAGKVPAHEVPGVTRGFVVVVALLIHKLSQVIGQDMAMRLVEQAWTTRESERSIADFRGASHDHKVRSR